MSAPTPHFLLFSESRRRSAKSPPCDWRFVLQSLDGSSRLEAEDAEPAVGGERLELLAVVRGLEALEQPSRVTLVTPSKYVSRGLSYGLQDWRENDWNWEHHGQMVPIKNRDLWQRLDRALAFHRVQCRTAPAETTAGEPQPSSTQAPVAATIERSPKPVRDAAKPCSEGRPAADWRGRTRRIWNRVNTFFRGLKARWSEMEPPVGRWRIS
jgi:ribonuclease HI